MQNQTTAYPQWTEYRKKNGLDPLGMQNGSINLYQRLLPGISNVTLRMRYYGLYAWLAATYARVDGSTSAKNWQRFVRRAEALYALTASYHDDTSGIAGSRWAGRKLSEPDDTIDFAVHADPDATTARYLQQAWGAYGAAYGSQLFETGVLAQAEHAIPVPSSEFGDRLSHALPAAWGECADIFLDRIQQGHVTADDLDALEPIIPSGIEDGSTERAIYEELLFASGPLKRPPDTARRETMLLLIEAAHHLNKAPDASSIRWLLYAGLDQTGAQLRLEDPNVALQGNRWRVYQANDLLHYAYETLLAFSLTVLEGYPGGLTLERLLAECLQRIASVSDTWPTSWAEFEAALPPPPNPWNPEAPTSEFALTTKIADGASDTGVIQPESAWAALQLVPVVLARARRDGELITKELGALDREGFHSLVTEGVFVDSLRSLPFNSAAMRLMRERIINRHLWVAHRKFRYQGDYTFLMEVDEGRVRTRAPAGPVFTSPRLGSALAFLHDLHLIDESGLTGHGIKLRAAS